MIDGRAALQLDVHAEADFLTPAKAAAICGVTRRTIYNWLDQGKLHRYKTPSGQPRIQRAELIQRATAETIANAGTDAGADFGAESPRG